MIHSIAWVVQTLYFFSLIPQIFLNARLKTTRGLSDLMLLGYVLGYQITSLYAFLLGLPVAYKVMVPLCFGASCVMLMQRFYYDSSNRFFLMLMCMFIGILPVIFIPLAWKHPYLVGHICGWVGTIIWILYQVPQVIKISISRSVYGFSFGLLSLIAFGNCLEIFIGFIAGLPAQTILSALRGLIIYGVFCIQFLLYSR